MDKASLTTNLPPDREGQGGTASATSDPSAAGARDSGNRQAFRILAIAAALIGIYAVFAWVAPWPAQLAETDYQSCMIRLEAFFLDAKPRAVVVGSSLTGRLLPEYFEGTALAPVDNMGLEGCPPEFGLTFVLTRPPPVVIIEANSLLRPHGETNEAALRAASRDFRFQMCRYLPVLRARSRPSSILYSWLKTHSKHSSAASIDPSDPPVAGAAAEAGLVQPAAPDPSSEKAEKEELRAQIKSLQASGCRVALVYVPNNRPRDPRDGPGFEDELARELKLENYDVREELRRRGYVATYTDGEHLTPASAREACRAIAELMGGRR